MISILSNHIQDRRNFASEIQSTPLNLFDKNRKWKMFSINKVFDVIESTKGKVTFDLLAGDEIPYISAKKKDNGFDYFVSKEGNEEYISKGNGVVFINLGDGSGGYSTYQPSDFIGMSGKTSVGYNSNLNVYNAMFLITILDKQRYKYSFGRSWTGTRFDNTKLYLPCDNDDMIDWEFMENYIKSLPNGNIL